MAGYPLLLYGRLPVANARFEVDADGAAPSSWDTSQSVNPDARVSTDEAQYPGPGIPSTRSLRLNVATGAAGDKTVVRQRFQDTALFDHARRYGLELAVVALVRPADADAQANAAVRMVQYAGGDATVGSGAVVASPAPRTIALDSPGEWGIRADVGTVEPTTEWVEVSLEYEIGTFGAASWAYFDRVYCGALVDFYSDTPGDRFARRFNRFRPDPELGYAWNHGDGEVEIVRTRTHPYSEIDLRVANVLKARTLSRRLDAMSAWLQGSTPGKFTVWCDRTEHENRMGHFQECVMDPSPRIDWPAGVARNDWRLEFVAVSEAP